MWHYSPPVTRGIGNSADHLTKDWCVRTNGTSSTEWDGPESSLASNRMRSAALDAEAALARSAPSRRMVGCQLTQPNGTIRRAFHCQTLGHTRAIRAEDNFDCRVEDNFDCRNARQGASLASIPGFPPTAPTQQGPGT